ncbi:MAG TPA: ribonuclease HII [Gaiellales bacterium]|jgi:ribonuclease HII|nr:ribonuclease HII [Gaiellales bacterium]
MAVSARRRRPARPGRRLLAHDRGLGARLVAGADEAGRGSLAGPLVAAAVCLDVDRLRGPRCAPLGLLDDSKRHTEESREDLFDVVVACAEQVAVCVVPAAEIDRRGLHRSNLYALGRALCALDPEPDVCLTDGFPVPGCPRRHRAVVGGDATSAAIAAASIVAKVTRDRFMRRIAPRYPGFGFEQHVGYITPEHTRAVQTLGPTPLHRRSFEAMAYAQLDLGL